MDADHPFDAPTPPLYMVHHHQRVVLLPTCRMYASAGIGYMRRAGGLIDVRTLDDDMACCGGAGGVHMVWLAVHGMFANDSMACSMYMRMPMRTYIK